LGENPDSGLGQADFGAVFLAGRVSVAHGGEDSVL